MKKALLGVFITLIALVVCGSIYILMMFQGPIVADISERVQYDSDLKEISLPWYLKMGIEEFARWDGVDADGKSYTWFSYELPDLWEDAEMECIVSWSDESTKLYLGEPRAMDCIDEDFDYVEWSFQ